MYILVNKFFCLSLYFFISFQERDDKFERNALNTNPLEAKNNIYFPPDNIANSKNTI